MMNLSLYISNVFIDKVYIPATGNGVCMISLKEKLLTKNKDIISGMQSARLVLENIPSDIDENFKNTLDSFDLFLER